MYSRTVPSLLLVLCLLLAGCVGFTADDSSPTPTVTSPTPDDRFDLRVANDREGTVTVRAWFVAGALDGVVVTAANGTNATYDVAELCDRPVAVGNASAVTPLGDVDRSIGIRLSGGVDGVARADVTGADAVVYAVLSGGALEDGTTTDAGGAVRAGAADRVEFVGVAACSAGAVTGVTVTVDATGSTAAVRCAG